MKRTTTTYAGSVDLVAQPVFSALNTGKAIADQLRLLESRAVPRQQYRFEHEFDRLIGVGFSNGPPSWAEMERVLDGKPRRSGPLFAGGPPDDVPWSRKRETYQPPGDNRTVRSSIAYAELHAHSAYSFLDGASAPEELVEEAARLDLRVIALTDHNGLYGAAPGPTSRIRWARICWCWPAVRKAIGDCRGSWPRRIWSVAKKASRVSTSMRSPTRRAGTGTF